MLPALAFDDAVADVCCVADADVDPVIVVSIGILHLQNMDAHHYSDYCSAFAQANPRYPPPSLAMMAMPLQRTLGRGGMPREARSFSC